MENGRVLAPFLYAWVSEDECAPDLRGHQSRLRPTAIQPALECRSATRFTLDSALRVDLETTLGHRQLHPGLAFTHEGGGVPID